MISAPPQIPPQSVSDTLSKAKVLHGEGQLDQARSLYESVLAREPANADALHLLGLLRFQAGELVDAETLIRQALAQRPVFMRAHSNLGAVLMAAGRHDEARASFRAALELDPADVDARFNLGAAAQALDLLDEAAACYREVIARSPDMHEARLNLGVVLLDSGDPDAALVTLDEVVKRVPGMAQAHYNIGIALKSVGQFEVACNAFKRATELAPESTDALFNLGNTLKNLGRLDEAERALRLVLSQRPGLARAHLALGGVLSERGDLNEALGAFTQAVEIDAEDTEAQHAIALTRLQLGDARGALHVLDRILERTPGSTRELSLKAVALGIAGEEAAARQLADLDRFLAPRIVDCVVGYDSMNDFNEALAEHVLSHPTLMESPDRFATRNGLHSLEVLAGDEQPVPALRGMIEREVNDYIASHPRDSSHPFLFRPPARWHLNGWAVVMREQGHQVAHIHPTAWLSGVYYVQVPAGVSAIGEGHAGWIEFGRPDSIFQRETPLQTCHLRPEPGKMVLFPGYFYHRTVPLQGDDPRICVAFDVVRDD